MIVFRNADSRFPFVWESHDQPSARWHGEGEGPAQYFADTPDGAWAELIRHEEIRDRDDLATITRAIWAAEISDTEDASEPSLPEEILLGGLETHSTCQVESGRLREGGATRIIAPSAALLPGEARGWGVDEGLIPAPLRDGRTIVLFGRRPEIVAWQAVFEGRPSADLLPKVRHLQER